MYRVGQKEIDAIGKVLLSGKIFRYGKAGRCERFERRYGEYLGTKHVLMTSSGTTALTAALVGLDVGPGDEVIVPSHTYMATALSVLAAGAIPVIVDIDESLTLDPEAFEDAMGPRTRAVVPVHLWGLPCDMNSIMRIARRKGLKVVEDACQSVGGGYRGKMLGAIGHAGAFSFNYYKNMTCGEGGAVVTNNRRVLQRASSMIDPCNMYWTGRKKDVVPFAANGSRASEVQGAMLNAQLDRLPGMISAMRRQKKRILSAVADTALVGSPCHSLDHECGAHTAFLMPTPEQADRFAAVVGGIVTGKTGRHVYTEWDPIFAHEGSHHRALDPFKLPQNRKCRKRYTKRMCARSLDILGRTVVVANHPDRKAGELTALIKKIKRAAKTILI